MLEKRPMLVAQSIYLQSGQSIRIYIIISLEFLPLFFDQNRFYMGGKSHDEGRNPTLLLPELD